MNSIAKAFIALLALLSLGCTSAAPLPAKDALGIGLSMHYADSAEGTRQPILEVEFVNSSDSPVAFSKTFGYGAFHWIGVQIRDAEGHLVPYPVDADLFHRPPLSCIQPNTSESLSLNLKGWHPLYGGRKILEDRYSFSLPPGVYKVQIIYAPSARAALRKCRPLSGIVRSEWLLFHVEASGR